VAALAQEVARYPNVAALGDWRAAAPAGGQPVLVPWRARLHGAELSLFTTLTTFGAPRDVTLAEAAVELFWPADEQSAAVLRGWAEHGGGNGMPGYLAAGSGAGTGW